MKRLLTLLLALATMAAWAQQTPRDTASTKKPALTVSCQVKDNITRNALDTAYVQLLRAADTTMVDTGTCDVWRWDKKVHACMACVTVHEPGRYLIRISSDGYKPRLIPFEVKKFYKNEFQRELKEVALARVPKEQEYMLNEVVVKATKVKFFVDGDTLVYNADAFELAEGSMLDALIKKLPGVELKSGGVITVNGKQVDALLLNGKELVNDERELMLENLPSYTVKNVQAYERTPEQYAGTKRGEMMKKEMVMNIKLKREYQSGWIANAEGGASPYNGRPVRYMGRLFGMHYNDRGRFNIYANANNLHDQNEPGEDNDASPLGQAVGLQDVYKAGFGIQRDLSVEEGTGSASYSGSGSVTWTDTENASHSDSETFLQGGNMFGRSYTNSQNHNFSVNTGHSYYSRRRFQPDERRVKTLNTNAYMDAGYSRQNNEGSSASATLNQNVAERWGKEWMDSISLPTAGALLRQYATNRTVNQNRGNGYSANVSANGNITVEPAHNDRVNLNVSGGYDFSKSDSKSFDHNLLQYPSNPAQDDDFRNRHNHNYNQKHSASLDMNFGYFLGEVSEDMRRFHSLNISNNTRTEQSRSNQSLYLLHLLSGYGASMPLGELPSVTDLMSVQDHGNSTRTQTRNWTNTTTFGYQFFMRGDTVGGRGERYHSMDLRVALPVAREWMDYNRGTYADTLSRTTLLPAPSIGFFGNNEKKGFDYNISYNMSINAPTLISQAMVTDTSNPLVVSENNPNLKNTIGHSVSAFFTRRWRYIMGNVSAYGSLQQHSMAMSYVMDRETGKSITRPENVEGNWNANADARLSTHLDKNKRLYLEESTSYYHNHSVDLSGVGTDLTKALRSVVLTHNLSESLKLTWDVNKKLALTASGRLGWQRTTSKRADFADISAYDFNYALTARWELPWNFQVSTDATMYSRRGYNDPQMNTNELVWNARLSKRLLHGNLIIMADGFDLLGKLSNVRRTVDAQGRTETFYSVVPRYGLLHVFYRINKKPKKRAGAEEEDEGE